MTASSSTIDRPLWRAFEEALRRASLALARHEREVVELETRLARTRRALETAGYLGDRLPHPSTGTAPTAPRKRTRLSRLRVAIS